CLAQIAGLTALQRSLHASNPYLAYKTVHLLVYPLVILAAIAVDAAWAALTGMARGAWARVAAWSLPMLLLVALSRTDVPRRPLRSPITAPVHRAGMWAKANLPRPCVDYMVQH